MGGIVYTLHGSAAMSANYSFNHYNSRGDVTVKSNSGEGVVYAGDYTALGSRSKEYMAANNEDWQRSNTKDEDVPGYANEGFRFRDLETGVFINRDPAGFVDGPNLYCYVKQNPWTKFDPLGLEPNKEQVGTVEQFTQRMDNSKNKVGQRTGEAARKTMFYLGSTGRMIPKPVATAPFNAVKGGISTRKTADG